MALARKQFWDTREFGAFLESRAAVPFAWGTNDCLTCAADGMLAICGVQPGDACDPAAEFRGKYSDARGAMAVAKKVTGSADMLVATAYMAEKVGLVKRAAPLAAQRGDVVLVEDGGRLLCGLVGLSGRWVYAPGETGLRKICILQTRHAWTY